MKYKKVKKVAYHYLNLYEERNLFSNIYSTNISYNNILELALIVVKYRKLYSSHYIIANLKGVLKNLNLNFLDLMLITRAYYNQDNIYEKFYK